MFATFYARGKDWLEQYKQNLYGLISSGYAGLSQFSSFWWSGVRYFCCLKKHIVPDTLNYPWGQLVFQIFMEKLEISNWSEKAVRLIFRETDLQTSIYIYTHTIYLYIKKTTTKTPVPATKNFMHTLQEGSLGPSDDSRAILHTWQPRNLDS